MTAAPRYGQGVTDWFTGLPRERLSVKARPTGKNLAVCFVLNVEVWGQGHGANFRPDMVGRKADLVDESFRRYTIHWGVTRVGRLFKAQGVFLSIALNAPFSRQHADVRKKFRASVPDPPIIAHGINKSTELLPLENGVDA